MHRRRLLSPLRVLPQDFLFLSALPVGTCSVLTGPRQPPPPLAPGEGALAVVSPRPCLAPRAGPWVLRCCHSANLKETMAGQQNNLPHTGAPSSQSPNVWAHWLLCRQPGPEQPAFSAHAGPLPTLPQWGSLCSWGYWGWPPHPGLCLLQRQRWKDEFGSTRKKRGLKADSKGFLWTLLRAVETGKHPSPALPLTGCGTRASACPSLFFSILIHRAAVPAL